MAMKKVDFSDFEILAIHDCKVAEVALLVWTARNSELKLDHASADPEEIEKISQDLLNSVITKLGQVDNNLIEYQGEGGANIASNHEDFIVSREVEFTEEVCQRPNVPVFLRRKRKEEYSEYMERISKFLEVTCPCVF